jgi:FkbH-like protein
VAERPLTDDELIRAAEAAWAAGDRAGAIERYLDATRITETPGFKASLKLVDAFRSCGRVGDACTWLKHAIDAARSALEWQAAAGAFARLRTQFPLQLPRRVKVALAGSYTTTLLAGLIRLCGFREGLDIDLYESRFGQYAQDLLDPASELHAFQPAAVILAVHEGALQLPDASDRPHADVDNEFARWRRLWEAAARNGARVIQHGIALRPEHPLGHLAGRVGSRYAMARQLNLRFLQEAPADVMVVDCDRLASVAGASAWFDDRYWYLTKQAVGPEALPALAKHTAAVLAASLGMSRKCLVLDLDGTLWGGVIGEDGLGGIRLGAGPAGEAFVDFQSYLLDLKRKGVLLAVASKNNEAEARAPFEQHPDMRLQLDDFAAFKANWDDKASNLRAIAGQLNLSLNSLVMVDDNPAERALIRQQLPEVDVITLPEDPAGYRRALAGYLRFESVALTEDDMRRTEQYRARQAAAALEASVTSLEEFHRSLQMEALVLPFDEFHLPRIAQLIAKTNQFNLSGRRWSLAELRAMVATGDAIHFYLKLRDRFVDHGLVAAMIARCDGETAFIDTWVMSCRVIGRTVEAEMLSELSRRAIERGCRRLQGIHVATGRNEPARDVYRRLGFALLNHEAATTTWDYDLDRLGPILNGVISRESSTASGGRRIATLMGEQIA